MKALIFNENRHVLALKEDQDAWSLPGGGLDHGEDAKAGILRELAEELGVTAATIADIASVETFYLEFRQTWLMWIVFRVTIAEHDFTLGEGVSEAMFINPAVLKDSQDPFEAMVYKVAR